ncbi:MAG: glutamate--cysteine ligase [Candidatus Schekmanbacteria bacterium GWA2_38_11]|uniref:Glutamate--cysteine ligase n=1 Tax=Candidatus Schekmanbacteria bacterium GWA2_38_11 TaxID=1817876 RepID=A0A1F7RGU4_9BACT|nr:MAG: glutamate--cysteine ligase [Candidatus Schekmanbacteria bacterium GWA2_38_11]
MDIVQKLHGLLLGESKKIRDWIELHLTKVRLPIYSSHDIRNSGFKVAPVDANLFPGGFNNLCKNSKKMSASYFAEYIAKDFTNAKKILIIAEEHTRNKFYLENLFSLKSILEAAGFQIRIGVLKGDFDESRCFETAEKNEIKIYKIQIRDNKASVKDFVPDIIIDNNDFTEGEPVALKSIIQPIVPQIDLGWFRRKKSNHFRIYNQLIEEFSLSFNIDKWFLSEFYDYVDDIDFKTGKGFEEVGDKIGKVITLIKKKYEEYDIKEKPFVFVKNNAGTYGMAIMNAENGRDFTNMNRATRNKMSFGKGKTPVESLIIQEGVPTIDKVDGYVAEPLIYLIGEKPVGGFFRLNTKRTTKENLNTRGMLFESDNLCPMNSDSFGKNVRSNVSSENIKIYKFISLISTITQGYEIAELSKI